MHQLLGFLFISILIFDPYVGKCSAKIPDELYNSFDETLEATEPHIEGDLKDGGRNITDDIMENPEETGPYLEGDINDDGEVYRKMQRNGIMNHSLRWPNGIVPYVIRGSFSKQELAVINHAFNEYHTKTCIRFRPRTIETDFVTIKNNGDGCWSSVGRLGGEQILNLQNPKCFSNYGTTIHELMHVLGFYHEQNRYERDQYVKVISENVKSGMMINFQKLPPLSASAFGVNYDYGSLMHYKATSFSKNGKPTLVALKSSPDVSKMGQRIGFSPGDIKKINRMYKCSLVNIY
ncbi:zinc metalloproteinase nas-1 [Haematobia irritans]|uniref:zinc metalloproteinase nas-1 n=1 Tax=Haematobia irritans TaxID=7368 RepID=UPI003F4F6D01